MSGPLLDVRDVLVTARARPTVDRVSFRIGRGEAYGLVGEPGCGMSTLGYAVVRLVGAAAGQVIFDGTDLLRLRGAALRRMRQRVQMVFPDPQSGLDRRRPVMSLIGDGLRAHGMAADGARLRELAAAVELPSTVLASYPPELTAAQLRRVGIARALAVGPELLVIDGPVRGLDVSAQAQLLTLLDALRVEHGLTYLIMDHDLGVVRHLSDRIGVMYEGGLVEEAPAGSLLDGPGHPYTQALVSAVPLPDPELEDRRRRILLTGDLLAAAPAVGCRFRAHCPWRRPHRCADEEPSLRPLGEGRRAACHYAESVRDGPLPDR